MPRPLVFSNGSFFVGLDDRCSIRDLFYPQVGRWNHLSGHPIRMGFWVKRGNEETFAWTEDEAWQIEQRYREHSLVAETSLNHEQLGIAVTCTDSLSHRANWYVRSLGIQNTGTENAEVRVFLSHDLRIMESDIGDTAFYHPTLGGVIHYKGGCYFLFGGTQLHQYACGLKGFGGYEGTWRDAEDGELGMNPIAQGSVDSTISLQKQIGKGKCENLVYWILAADDLETLDATFQDFKKMTPQKSISETDKHWKKWLQPARNKLSKMPPELAKQCGRSLLIMRTHIDNAGAIIAATDSDIMKTNRANYCYMWPRDGALISSVLDAAGQHALPRAFFEFCNRILPHNPPVLRQKYTADGKVGATWHPWIINGKPQIPFQEDETALMILAMWEHHRCSPDPVALKHHMDVFVLNAADYLVAFRNPTTHLPLPSYDLWEERLGVHTYTVATVIAGLEAAADIAKELSHPKEQEYRAAATQTRNAMLTHLVDMETGRFLRGITHRDGGGFPDETVDASTLYVGLLGVLPITDERILATAEAVEERLWVEGLGGVARYEGDYYFRRHDHLPGNPWIICTLWLAQHKLRTGDKEAALMHLKWASDHAARTGVLPEQLDAVTGEHLSVSPLTWSHAEFVRTCFECFE